MHKRKAKLLYVFLKYSNGDLSQFKKPKYTLFRRRFKTIRFEDLEEGEVQVCGLIKRNNVISYVYGSFNEVEKKDIIQVNNMKAGYICTK